MIINIHPIQFNSINKIIYYHENKIEKGHASALDSNIYCQDYNSKNMALKDLCNIDSTLKTAAYHIDIDFDINDNISNTQFDSLLNDWLEKMNFKNRSYLLYEHHDKNYHHFHIVIPNTDFNGQRWNDSNCNLRNISVCRNLEKKYDLRVLSHEKTKDKQIKKEKAIDDYSLNRALITAIDNNDNDINHWINLGIIKKEWLDKELKNDQIRYQLKKNGHNKYYSKIYQNLDEKGFITRSEKKILTQQLLEIRKSSNSIDEFIDNIKKQNLYVRILHKNDKTVIQYGNPDTSFYFIEKSLSSHLTMSTLINYYNDQNNPKNTSKIHINNIIDEQLSKCKTIDELKVKLSLHQIKTIIHTNNSGTYGYSFQHQNITFKASEINRNYSFKNLHQSFNKNQNHFNLTNAIITKIINAITNNQLHNIHRLNEQLKKDNIQVYYNHNKRIYNIYDKNNKSFYSYEDLKIFSNYNDINKLFQQEAHKLNRLKNLAFKINHIGFKIGSIEHIYSQAALEAELEEINKEKNLGI